MAIQRPDHQYKMIRKGDAFTRLTVQFTDAVGAPDLPSGSVIARIYRINPADGTMVLDVAMGTSGQVILTSDVLSGGLYSAALSLAPAVYEHYEIIVQYGAASPYAFCRITLFLSEDLKSIYDNRNVEFTSKRTGYAAG